MKQKIKINNSKPKCPLCHDDIGMTSTNCPGCHAQYHPSCVNEISTNCASCETKLGAEKTDLQDLEQIVENSKAPTVNVFELSDKLKPYLLAKKEFKALTEYENQDYGLSEAYQTLIKNLKKSVWTLDQPKINKYAHKYSYTTIGLTIGIAAATYIIDPNLATLPIALLGGIGAVIDAFREISESVDCGLSQKFIHFNINRLKNSIEDYEENPPSNLKNPELKKINTYLDELNNPNLKTANKKIKEIYQVLLEYPEIYEWMEEETKQYEQEINELTNEYNFKTPEFPPEPSIKNAYPKSKTPEVKPHPTVYLKKKPGTSSGGPR